MKKKITIRLWVGLCVSVLLLSSYYYDGKPNSDIDVFLVWSMVVLTFPVGLLVAWLLGGVFYILHYLFSINVYSGYFQLVATWIVFFVAGYAQWGKLVPYVVNKIRDRCK